MSADAVRWALQQAPSVPPAKGQPAPASCRAVLVGLAYHANPHGRHAFPAVSTLVAYTDLGERTVRACLDRLAAAGLIRRTDPAVVAAAIPRADRRPDGYDLAVERHRDTPAAEPVEQSPQPDSGVHAPHPDEVQTPHPAPGSEVQPSHPAEPNGVQCLHQRGAGTAPEQSMNAATPKGVAATTRARGRARGTTTLAELSDTAVKPFSRRVVDEWRQARPDVAGYRPQTLRELAKAADGILRDGGDPDLVRAALDEWDRRTDVHSPRILPNLYDDAVKARRAASAPTQPQQSASGSGTSKRDTKALGFFALADKLAAEEDATVSPLFPQQSAIEGTTTA